MSVSIDYAKIDRVQAFADFLDILSKPQELQRLTEGYRTQSEKLREYLAAKLEVDSVETYVLKKEKEADELIAKAEAHKNECFRQADSMLAEAKSALAKAEEKNREANTLMSTVNEKENAVNALRSEYDTKLAALQKDRAKVEADRQQLQQEQAEWQQKSAALRNVLGG